MRIAPNGPSDGFAQARTSTHWPRIVSTDVSNQTLTALVLKAALISSSGENTRLTGNERPTCCAPRTYTVIHAPQPPQTTCAARIRAAQPLLPPSSLIHPLAAGTRASQSSIFTTRSTASTSKMRTRGENSSSANSTATKNGSGVVVALEHQAVVQSDAIMPDAYP